MPVRLNVVEGNFISTQSGDITTARHQHGVLLYGASGNTIGGTNLLPHLVRLSRRTTRCCGIQTLLDRNVVAGNEIGTAADGTRALGNFSDGVAILDSPANLIGGSVAGAGNIIAGNSGSGVHLSGSGTTGNLLWGNLIGTNSEGSDLLGNSGDGVFVENVDA